MPSHLATAPSIPVQRTQPSTGPYPRIIMGYGAVRTHPSDILHADLDVLKRGAASVNNFAARLVERMVPDSVRKISNVRGVKGKNPIDSNVIEQVRAATIELYAVNDVLKDSVWRGCVKAIDENCRRLAKKL